MKCEEHLRDPFGRDMIITTRPVRSVVRIT